MYALIELFFSLGLFINAALFIPQAVKIYREKTACDFSLLTFGGFNLIQIAMVLHGIIHQDWFLTIGMLFSFFTCFLITIQIIIAMLQRK